MSLKIEAPRKLTPAEEALGIGKETAGPHWPYYFHCVYPGYQSAYYEESRVLPIIGVKDYYGFKDTSHSRYGRDGVTYGLLKWMVPGRLHNTDSLPRMRWYYWLPTDYKSYNNWFRYC